MSESSYLEYFPEDFNAESLQSKVNDDTKLTLAKYRRKIYDRFLTTKTNFIDVPIDKDFSNNMLYYLNQELKILGLHGTITNRTETYIVGGENDPELEDIDERYIMIKAKN